MTKLGIKQARMLLIMLSEVSIDHKITNPEECINNDGSFSIYFEGVVNPFGYFIEAPEEMYKDFVEAIKRNLDSKMHKAARVYRRTFDRRRTLLSQASSRHSSAYDKLYRAYHARTKGLSHNAAAQREKERAKFDAEVEAITVVTTTREEIIHDRFRRLSNAATPGLSGMGFTQYIESLVQRTSA
jgi:hypothetical protein